MNLLIATSNPHKLDELRSILAPLGIEPVGLNETGNGDLPEPEETGETFEENAQIKAVAYARMTGRICLADDSGLEVDALNGAPGILSARYAFDGEIDDELPTHLTRAQKDALNNDKLLKELEGVPDLKRAARFVCCICVASPEGRVLAASRGTFEGRIAHSPRGHNGFGYDPLLLLPDGRSAAELPPEEKNQRSHRATAARALAPNLARLIRTGLGN